MSITSRLSAPRQCGTCAQWTRRRGKGQHAHSLDSRCTTVRHHGHCSQSVSAVVCVRPAALGHTTVARSAPTLCGESCTHCRRRGPFRLLAAGVQESASLPLQVSLRSPRKHQPGAIRGTRDSSEQPEVIHARSCTCAVRTAMCKYARRDMVAVGRRLRLSGIPYRACSSASRRRAS
jgi:hypothetical protein